MTVQPAEQTQDRKSNYLLLLFLFKGMGQDARQPGWQGGGGRGGEDAEPTDREIVLKTGMKEK